MADGDNQHPTSTEIAFNQRRPRGHNGRSPRKPQSEDQVPPSDSGAGHWYRIDLHIHTPASTDYQQPEATFLDILHRAEDRELDVIAFTDHNSVRGYAGLWREIEDLELLESLNRLSPSERDKLVEYRRLLEKILLLPGFEFTATFGFHILAIFPEKTTVRMMEHILLTLDVPESKFGSGEVGATTDVLRSYRVLGDAGALVIGAHVNSTHGIAMVGLNFGGQTKIAYTQDPYLNALEVTDLHLGDRARSTARFFNGTKAEYPRRMHCIQGSDAHRIERDMSREAIYGIGDRPTEALMPVRSFQALKDLFLSSEFDRTRPIFPITSPADEIRIGQTQGNTVSQSFHEHLSNKRSGSRAILMDVAAFANTNGGTIFIGASIHQKRPIVGVPNASSAAESLSDLLRTDVSPALDASIDAIESGGKTLLALRVPEGGNKPYTLAPGHIYVRREGKSEIASRDEIVRMVKASGQVVPPEQRPAHREERIQEAAVTRSEPRTPPSIDPPSETEATVVDEREFDSGAFQHAPSSGVEIVTVEEVEGVPRFTIRDLRHRRLISGVNPDQARGVWRDAIDDWRRHKPERNDFRWRGDFGVLKRHLTVERLGRYTLAWRSHDALRVFYAVNEESIRGPWKSLVAQQQRSRKPAPASSEGSTSD